MTITSTRDLRTITTATGPTRPTPERRDRLRDVAARLLARHSIDVLRVSLGLIFLGFGVLKFFPGLSPAEDLAMRTLHELSLGLLSGRSAVVLTAVAESFIGLTLISGRLLRTGLAVLAASLVGIMSPLVLFFGELFPHGPSLEGQYVLKDIVLAAAGMVVGARALGARLVVDRAATP